MELQGCCLFESQCIGGVGDDEGVCGGDGVIVFVYRVPAVVLVFDLDDVLLGDGFDVWVLEVCADQGGWV